MTDQYWMQAALALAEKAKQAGEIPVGALLVKDNRLIASGWNQPVTLSDPTAHAEVLVLRQAGQILKNYRLLGTTLYVTLEPCPMCAGSMLHARIKRLVFGAFDPKTGAAGSSCQLFHGHHVNHRIDVFGGVLADDCKTIIQNFFAQQRAL